MYHRHLIVGSFRTTAPMHVGSGSITRHDDLTGEDNEPCEVAAVVVDYEGRPCIPGAAIKGVARSWAEVFLPGEAAAIERIFGHRDAEDTNAEAGRAEFLTARIETLPSKAQLEAFEKYVPYWTPKRLTGIASHVGIDRFTGAAKANKLFFEEFVPEGVAFRVEIAATGLSDAEIALLLAILDVGTKHLTHPFQLGANGADGWGRVEWELESVKSFDPALAAGAGAAAAPVGFACCAGNWVNPGNATPMSKTEPHVTVDLTLEFQGPFLVNDGSRVKKDHVDDPANEERPNFAPLRRADGGVWLPSSSFRGALRNRAEFLLRSLDPNATGDPDEPPGAGPIERLFGETSRSSPLTIEEFAQVGHSVTRRQDFVAIDRFTGGAADGAKFDAIYADAPTLKTRLTLDLDRVEASDLALLALALRDVCEGRVPLGWGGAKGYGIARGRISGLQSSGLKPEWGIPASALMGVIDDDGKRWLNESLALLRGQAAEQAMPKPADMDRDGSHPAVGPPRPDPAPIAKPADVKRGWLRWRETKKGRQRYLATPNNPQGYPIHPSTTLAASLAAAKADEIEVDLEFEKGQPVRIRRAGEAWGAAPAAGQDAGAGDASASPRGRFIHPYYFVAFKDRSDFRGELADARPAGHRRYEPGRFSGTIRVGLTVETPLLACDDEDIVANDNGHSTYKMRVDADGRPIIRASSVRGMLRSAYEAVTNSRFGVFPARPGKGHTRRLAYRMPATEGLSLVPIRIEAGKARLMLGDNGGLPFFDRNAGRWKVPENHLHAAWVKRYTKKSPEPAPGAIRINGEFPKNGQPAWCWLQMIQHESPSFLFWAVREAAVDEVGLSPECPVRMNAGGKYRPLSRTLKAEGYFCVTNQNIENKHDERFFFCEKDDVRLDIDPKVKQGYEDLVRDYQAIHESDLKERRERGRKPEDYLGAEPGRTAWSRHVHVEDALRLDEGTLCYGRVEESAGGDRRLVALYPVIISRKLFERSPFDLLPERLRPATRIDGLSPADRVFGWVSQESGKPDSAPAYRGHVRVGAVVCETPGAIRQFPEGAVPLAILGQPKPQQGRFYLGNADGTAQKDGIPRDEAGYREPNRIRGPKVYPHHRVLNEAVWRGGQPTTQNRSITGWIRPGTRLTFDLHIENLSGLELGALAWLLSMDDGHFLRMGLGKPLGFGSVRAEIVEGGWRVADGSAWCANLAHWNAGEPASCDRELLKGAFEAAIRAANATLLDAFLQAAAGFEGFRVCYPPDPADPKKQGDHFEWFVTNESRDGRRFPLPDLGRGIPSLPENPVQVPASGPTAGRSVGRPRGPR